MRQLQSEYRRSMERSELLLPRRKEHAYEERMLTEHPVKGVLPFCPCEQAERYAYEITGRKNMQLIFERVPMNAKQICGILNSIFCVLEEGREYLLKEEHFLLRPEFIYVGFLDYQVELCYYPEYGISLKEQLEELFEQLLNHVDYKEQAAVSLVYALYRKIQEPEVSVLELKKEVEAAGGKEKVLTALYEPVKLPKNQREEKEQERQSTLRVQTESREAPCPDRQKQKVQKAKSWKEVLFGKWKERFAGELPVMVCEEEPIYVADTRTRAIRIAEAETPYLLSEEDGERIVLSKQPFYIGSLAEYVDYAIASETVSRFHAKIEWEAGRYFITDLNSTNGTKLNGCLLDAHKREEIREGDKLMFADRGYLFLCGD